MAVNLTDGDEGLFDRLGRIAKLDERILDHQTTGAASVRQEVLDIRARYDNDTELIRELQGDMLALQLPAASIQAQMRSGSERTVIEMVNDDNPQGDLTLPTALDELILQMEDSSDDINGNATTAVAANDAANTGDGLVIPLVLTRNTKKSAQHVRGENIVLTCIKDAQISGTAGREVFSVVGEAAVSDTRDPSWPGGSGISGTIRVTDPDEDAQSATGRNILTNSSFEDFATTDTPDNWTLTTGVAGTDIFEEGTTVHRGSKALAFEGDGTTLVAITQTLNTSGQTLGQLKPNSLYRIDFQIAADSGTTGTLRISVKDGSNNILDSGDAAVSVNSFATSYGAQGTTFATPYAIPTGTKVVIEMTTAFNNAKKVYVDSLAIYECTQFGGAGGPFINVLPGETDWVLNDKSVITVTQPDSGKFARFFDRYFGMYALGKQLPFDTGGTETISDTLIV